MRKAAMTVFLSFVSTYAYCGYSSFFFRNAADITTGTLSNARLDLSSVTERGQLTDMTQGIGVSSVTASSIAVNNLLTGTGSTLRVSSMASTFLMLDNIDGVNPPTWVSGWNKVISVGKLYGFEFGSNNTTDIYGMASNSNQFYMFRTTWTGAGGSTNNFFTVKVTSICIGAGTCSPGAEFSVLDGSISVSGNNAGLEVIGGSLTATGMVINSGGGGGIKFTDGTILKTNASVSTTGAIANLIITTQAAVSSIVVITADYVDIMGDFYSKVSTWVSINFVGIGGTDASPGTNQAKSSSTWYAIDFVSNGSTPGVIVSSNNSNVYNTPTMPTGYTKWRRVGYLFIDANGNIVPFYQSNNKVKWFTNHTMVNVANMSNTPTSVDLSTFTSPGATTVYTHYRITGNNLTVAQAWLWADGNINNQETGGSEDIQFQIDGFTNPSFYLDAVMTLTGARKLWYKDNGSDIGNFMWFILGFDQNVP